jgi:hypothetical protein
MNAQYTLVAHIAASLNARVARVELRREARDSVTVNTLVELNGR